MIIKETTKFAYRCNACGEKCNTQFKFSEYEDSNGAVAVQICSSCQKKLGQMLGE